MVAPAETEPLKDGGTQWDLDEALKDLKFGSYHIRILFFIGLLAMFSGMFPLSFTLTAGDLDYRCLVPECENANKSQIKYMPSWIRTAVPFKNEKPRKCKRFKASSNPDFNGNDCKTSFNSRVEQDCDSWVFATDELTIVKEFGIFCEYRKWKLSLLGTINNIGQFMGISLFGMVSDRFGRKIVLILCTVTAAVCGVCRGLSTNYILFAFLEFLGAFFACAIFLTSSTLAIELVNPKMRPLAVTIINVFFPIGSVVMGCLAWYFKNWRKLLIVSHFPALLFILYFWLIPESIRWLYTKGYIAEVNAILRKMPGSNNMELSEKVSCRKNSVKCQSSGEDDKKQISKPVPVLAALKKKHILFRLIRCTFLWVTCTLIYYGLSINSVELIGNKYLNFILTCAIDIPAIIITGFILNKIKRRRFQSITFFLSGIACIVSELIPTDMIILKLGFYLASKFAITIAFTILYVYTAEMFPTEVRQTLSATASTIGRTGSMIAPHTILLKDVFGQYATATLFGVVGILAGLLSTTFPETLNKKLPDTIEQAKFKDDS